MQLPADQKAYKAAEKVDDPSKKLAALKAFVHEYPESKLVVEAHQATFDVLLAKFPEQKAAIHKEAKAVIAHAAGEREVINRENSVAYYLAEAGKDGMDLKAAEKWATDAVRKDTRELVQREADENAVKYKTPKMTAPKVDSYYGQEHATLVQTLADVLYHEKKFDRASALTDQCLVLDPEAGDCMLTRAQIALAQNKKARALDQFELADLYGSVKAEHLQTLRQLYMEAHNASDAGLDAELDTRYRQVMPPPFTPARFTGKDAGHTPLLELFTGSGCHPCAAADLAVDGVLDAYSREDVVVLVFDQHIPMPDPLANPDSISRREGYSLGFTPSGYLDGEQVIKGGGSRENAEKLYKEFTPKLGTAIAQRSDLVLLLDAKASDGGPIVARATVKVSQPEALSRHLVELQKPATSPKPEKPGAAAAEKPATTPAPSRGLVVRFALVQREVTYSGENGIRFHHMVVRSLAKPTALELPSKAGYVETADASFDPAAISHTLSEYLTSFAKKNDSFGPITFLSTDTSLPMDTLGVAAWVEDAISHRVLQASFVPLSHEQTAAVTK